MEWNQRSQVTLWVPWGAAGRAPHLSPDLAAPAGISDYATKQWGGRDPGCQERSLQKLFWLICRIALCFLYGCGPIVVGGGWAYCRPGTYTRACMSCHGLASVQRGPCCAIAALTSPSTNPASTRTAQTPPFERLSTTQASSARFTPSAFAPSSSMRRQIRPLAPST